MPAPASPPANERQVAATYAGLDGCRGGWALALWQPAAKKLQILTLESLAGLPHLPQAPTTAVVDMPLVLEAVAAVGGRPCDREARALLPTGTKGSIFSAPTLAALASWRQGGGYAEVLAAQRQTGPQAPGLSLQAYHLLKHVDDLQRFVASHEKPACVEGHPELAFRRLHGAAKGALASKHTPLGRAQRQQLLTHLGMPWAAAWSARPRGGTTSLRAAMDDVLDACILAHVDHQRHSGEADCCPELNRARPGVPAIYF